jgi:adenylate cyclase
LEQQTATAEVLQVINSSPGDLAPVFDAMLERAMHLCGAAFGGLGTWQEERFGFVAVRGPEPLMEYIANNEVSLGSRDGFSRVASGEGYVQFTDIFTSELYQSREPYTRALVDLCGGRTTLSVPLAKDGAVPGVLAFFRQEVRPFTDKEIALVKNFAAQAVIAMENARLLTETREALDRQTATAEVLGIISSSPGRLEPVFDAILGSAVRVCAGKFGMLALTENTGFRGVAAHEVGSEFPATLSRIHEPPPGTGLNLLWETLQTVQIVDCATDPAYDPVRALNPAFATVRTALHVPMLRKGTLLGAIVIYRDQVLPFDDKEVELVENFAKQAVVAIENTRLITEIREALEQQTATAEVLQVINSSPGNLAPVFNAILEKAHTLCGAEVGRLLTYDGERFWPVAEHGVSRRFSEIRPGGFRPNPGNPFARVLEGEPLFHVADIRQVAAQYPDDPGLRVAADTGIRTALLVPLRKDQVLLGAITASQREVRPFTDKQIALLQNFAAQAVIAMENARLLGELHERTDQVAELNRGLEARVAEQVEELGRVGRLKRFLAPQLAELIVSQGDEKILESHRREIVVVFCDLRGYTAFTETAEPEEVLAFLREYHGALGPLVAQFEGTLDQFSGDGIMVFFNDPVPCPDPAERAVKTAMAMREAAGTLIAAWRLHGCDLGFGAGIAQGYATLGQIGFSERSGYTAIGTVCNLAARLCAEAKGGQILVSSRIAEAVKAVAKLEDLGNLELKGLRRPVAAFNVGRSTSAVDARPNLTVVARGPEA